LRVGSYFKGGVGNNRNFSEQADILGQGIKELISGDNTAQGTAQFPLQPGSKKSCTSTVQPTEIYLFPAVKQPFADRLHTRLLHSPLG
jgi:hypothetical protein